MTKSLILISSRPEDLVFGAEVAAVAGLAFKPISDIKQAISFLTREHLPILLIDASTEEQYFHFEKEVQETVGLFSEQINANMIHFLGAEDLEKVQYLIQSPLFGHYIMRCTSTPKDAGSHYGQIIKATLAERSFGLGNILKPGSKIQSIKLSSSAQKHNAVEAVKAYLLAAKFQSRMAAVIANAVDELLMNAMFDAPADELGRPLLSATPRSTVIPLENKSTVEMQVGYDGKYVAISAIDLFGSLDKSKLLTHISKLYAREEYKIRTTIAGAGIGLATVFRSGGSFFFVSENRVRTEVIVFFKRTENFREFKDQFRFISTQFYF